MLQLVHVGRLVIVSQAFERFGRKPYPRRLEYDTVLPHKDLYQPQEVFRAYPRWRQGEGGDVKQKHSASRHSLAVTSWGRQHRKRVAGTEVRVYEWERCLRDYRRLRPSGKVQARSLTGLDSQVMSSYPEGAVSNQESDGLTWNGRRVVGLNTVTWAFEVSAQRFGREAQATT